VPTVRAEKVPEAVPANRLPLVVNEAQGIAAVATSEVVLTAFAVAA
jgi:hypothetical protein